MASDNALTPEQILSAAEDVLRRYGPAKATVVDVARALGVSHGSVYRHFSSKAELREAVTRRWLDRAHDDLAAIAAAPGPAAERLHRWLSTLFAAKRRKAGEDPEMFATYTTLSGEPANAVEEHIAALTAQIAAIVEDGIRRGEFRDAPPERTARSVFLATAHFHDPAYAPEWAHERARADFDALWALLLDGLRAP